MNNAQGISTTEIENGNEKLKYENVTLLPERIFTAGEIADIALAGGFSECIVCDFEVKRGDGESVKPIFDQMVLAGFEITSNDGRVRIVNIDHHFENPDLYAQISSAHLAKRFIQLYGIQNEKPIFINHTDTDGLITTAILLGKIPPNEIFLNAVLAADHTGEENFIADTLQSLETTGDLLSLEEKMELLFKLGSGELHDIFSLFTILPEQYAQAIFDEYAARHYSRSRVEKLVPKFRQTKNGVFFAEVASSDAPDTTFLVSAQGMEEANIICVSRLDKKSGNQIIRVRMGKRGIERRLNLFETAYKTSDITHLEGRWNAGGNKRTGGFKGSLEEVANLIDKTLI